MFSPLRSQDGSPLSTPSAARLLVSRRLQRGAALALILLFWTAGHGSSALAAPVQESLAEAASSLPVDFLAPEEDRILHAGEGEGPRLIVHAKSKINKGFLKKLSKDYGLEAVELPFTSKKQHVAVLEAPASSDVDGLLAQLRADKKILAAEASASCSIADAAPFDNYVWSVVGPGDLQAQYGFSQLALHKKGPGGEGEGGGDGDDQGEDEQGSAHGLSKGRNVTVAVIDTGFDLEHPLLVGRWAQAKEHYDFIDGDQVPEDRADGRDDDGDGQADESYGHGTFVAGLVHLVAPEAEILPIRALDADGHASSYVLAAAIDHAVTHGADVINLSLTLPADSPLVSFEIEQAVREGVLVVAAAGNQGAMSASFPAAGGCSLAVTAVDEQKKKSPFANYGDWVSFAAPGDAVISAFPRTPRPDGQGDYLYAQWSGSSVATPFVSGLAALIRSLDHKLGPSEVSRYLALAAHSVDAENPDFAGGLGRGIPDALGSLLAVEDEVPVGDEFDLLARCEAD